MSTVYSNDTIIFQWYPPIPKDVNLVMTAVCKKFLIQASSLFGKILMQLNYFIGTTNPQRSIVGKVSFTASNMTWQIPFGGANGVTDPMYDCPVHFNLLQINPFASKWEWSPMKLVARTDDFLFKGPTKVGSTRYLPSDQLANRTAQIAIPRTSGLSEANRIAIGVTVPVVSLILLVCGAWTLWWMTKRRKSRAELAQEAETEAETDADMPSELKGAERFELSGGNVHEADYDNFWRELDGNDAMVKELYSEAAELDGSAIEVSPVVEDHDMKDPEVRDSDGPPSILVTPDTSK
jgi:hypothetical protein